MCRIGFSCQQEFTIKVKKIYFKLIFKSTDILLTKETKIKAKQLPTFNRFELVNPNKLK